MIRSRFLVLIFVCLVCSQGRLFPRGRQVEPDVMISGRIFIGSNTPAGNVRILWGRSGTVLLPYNGTDFTLSNIRPGMVQLKVLTHHAVQGSYQKILEYSLEPGAVTNVGNVVLTDDDMVQGIPIVNSITPNNSMVIADFYLNGGSLDVPKKKKNIFFSVGTWEDKLYKFNMDIIRAYQRRDYRGAFIVITGFTGGGEGQGDKTQQLELGLERAEFIYYFLRKNFDIKRNVFLLTSKGADSLLRKKDPDHSRNRRVEIKFYNQSPY